MPSHWSGHPFYSIRWQYSIKLSDRIMERSTNKLAYIWVNVPEIDACTTTDSIYMYYGNSSATDAQNKTGVWNSGYAGVWHLNETSGNNSDSTINNNTGVVEGNPTQNYYWCFW